MYYSIQIVQLILYMEELESNCTFPGEILFDKLSSSNSICKNQSVENLQKDLSL